MNDVKMEWRKCYRCSKSFVTNSKYEKFYCSPYCEKYSWKTIQDPKQEIVKNIFTNTELRTEQKLAESIKSDIITIRNLEKEKERKEKENTKKNLRNGTIGNIKKEKIISISRIGKMNEQENTMPTTRVSVSNELKIIEKREVQSEDCSPSFSNLRQEQFQSVSLINKSSAHLFSLMKELPKNDIDNAIQCAMEIRNLIATKTVIVKQLKELHE